MSRRSRKKAAKSAAVIVFTAVVIFAAAALIGVLASNNAYRLFLEASYPTDYSEYVDKYSAEFGIDRYLIFAVIKTESGFDPNAVSDTGARGLMQIMEPTFDWIKFRLSDAGDRSFDEMFDPAVNIRYGAYLMDFLMERYSVLETAAAAYFSGTGTVDEWLSDSDISADGKALDVIPSKSAAHYVSKVCDAYRQYTELYAG